MDYKHVVEIKNDFLDFFSRLITPNIYECLYGASKQSNQYYNNLIQISANNNIKIPDITDIFIQILSDVPHLNEAEIEKIYKDVKLYSNCTYFDDLVRACFKSYVIFLTFNPASENSKFCDSEYYKEFSIKNFIHKCYIESAKYFSENPEIFFRKNKKQEIYEIIRKCIEVALKNTIPYEEIIKEYFEINQQKEHKLFEKNNIHHIGRAVQDFMSKGQYGSRPNINNIIIDKSSTNDDRSNQKEIEGFIDLEKNLNNDFIVEKVGSNDNLRGGNADYILNTEASKNEVLNNNSVSVESTHIASTSQLFDRGKKIEAEVNAIRYGDKVDKLDKQDKQGKLDKISENNSDTQTNSTISHTVSVTTNNDRKSDYSETSFSQKNSETSVTSKNNSTEIINSPIKIKKNNLDRIDENLESNNELIKNNISEKNMKGGKKNSIKITTTNIKSDKMSKAEEQFKNFAKENKIL